MSICKTIEPELCLWNRPLVFEKNVDGSKVTVVAVDSGGSLDLFMQTMYAGQQKGSIANVHFVIEIR